MVDPECPRNFQNLLYSSLCCVWAREDKRGQKRRNGFPAGNQQLLVHSTWDSRVVMGYKNEFQSSYFMCTLYIGDILVSKKAMLPNPCYLESEVFLYNLRLWYQRPSTIHYLELSFLYSFLYRMYINDTRLLNFLLPSISYNDHIIIYNIAYICILCVTPLWKKTWHLWFILNLFHYEFFIHAYKCTLINLSLSPVILLSNSFTFWQNIIICISIMQGVSL
jgi:hypothetical protein